MVFTAHKREDSDGIKIQSVEEHSRNVSELASLYAEKLQASSIGKVQGLFHDSGKWCGTFDDYINGRNGMHRGEIDHCYAGAKYLTEFQEKAGISTRAVTELISRTIISHHGLHDWLDENGEDTFHKRLNKDIHYQEIEKNLKGLITDEKLADLLKSAAEEYSLIENKIRELSGRDAEKYRFYIGMLERTIESVLVDADRTDTADFVYHKKTERPADPQIWNLLYDRMECFCTNFEKNRTDDLSLLRSNISNRCRAFSDHRSGICRLIVPTGGGKTISSLRFAVNYCKKHRKERVFYIAPFMSILEQNSDVIRNILGDENVLEHHSNMISVINEREEEYGDYELRTEKWDLPVIATTLVQFLNAAFDGGMASVRHFHRLCNAVIIIDDLWEASHK